MLRRKSHTTIFTCFFALMSMLSFSGRAQNELPANNPEKIYAHISKSFFITGETIWFKLYVTYAYSNMPLDISKVGYVELLDSSNKPILQAKVLIDSASGNGSFVVPSYVSTGNYLFRAYTSISKNYGPSSYFHQVISIFNPSKAAGAITKDPTSVYRIDAAIEGGNLIEAIKSNIVLAVSNQFGEGSAGSGKLLNQRNETIATTQLTALGIGNISFIPNGGDTYKIIVDLPGKQSVQYILPAASRSGYILQLIKGTDNVVRLQANSSSDNNNNNVTLSWINNQGLLVTNKAKVANSSANFQIDEKELAAGLTIFRLSGEQGQLLSERPYYKKQQQRLSLQLQTDKSTYNRRDKVQTELKLPNNVAAADLSMSVILIDSLQSLSGINVDNTSFAGEFVNELGPGVSKKMPGIDATNDIIDNTILVYTQSTLDANKRRTSKYFIPEYAGHIITGKVTNRQTGAPAAGVLTYLSVPGERFYFSNSRSDVNGIVKFDVKKFFGTDNIIVQTDNSQDSIYRIEIDNPFSEAYAKQNYSQLYLSPDWQQSLLSRITSAQVENAFNQTHPEQFYLPNFYDTTSFFGKPDKTYLLDDYTRFSTMEEVMREYVSEVQIRKSGSNFRYRTYNLPFKIYFEENPLVLLDGVPVFNINKIVDFDPLKVKKLDLITRRYFQGGRYYDGIASYNTYTGDLAGYQLDPNSLVIEYRGMQLLRQFRSPSYDSVGQTESRIPDFRNTLYWAPDIKIKRGQTIPLQFYTSDVPGKYAVIVQGISNDGKSINLVHSFEVKK